MNMNTLEQGIIRHGTPIYVFDIDKMTDTVGNFRKILGEDTGICFAMKANPFLTGDIEAYVDRIEVCSMGEFQICRERQIPTEKLLISGVLKEDADICEILNICRGACIYTVESMKQYQILSDWCNENNESLQVYLRLTSGNQFGMDEETIGHILELRDIVPSLKILGIHYFSGTQKKTADKYREELCYLDRFLRGMEEKSGFPIQELEYGPGFSVPYFAGQLDTREADMNVLAEAVSMMKWKGRVMLEMGRGLVADCGYYLAGVKDKKENKGRKYCIVDGGIHQLNYDGQIRGMYEPLIRVSPERQTGRVEEWTVCGALCTANDILVQRLSIQNLEIGDILVFERTGAYAVEEGMALFLSHALPKVALYSKKKGWKLIREKIPTYQWNMERR